MHPAEILKELTEKILANNFEETLEFDQELDRFFGISHTPKLTTDPDYYENAEQSALSTSYCDYLKILNSLPPGKTLVDLGAGYSRGSLLARYLKIADCLSVEILQSRTSQAKDSLENLGLTSECILEMDLVSFNFESYEYFYLYFPKNLVLYTMLRNLIGLARDSSKYIYVCESHGDVIDFINQMPEIFSCIQKIPTSVPRHRDSIFKFKIDLGQQEEPDIIKNPALWYLHHFDKDYVLKYRYLHKLSNRWIDLFVKLEHLDYREFAKKYYFQNRFSNFLYRQGEEMILEHFLPSSNCPQELQDLLENPSSENQKVIFDGEYRLIT